MTPRQQELFSYLRAKLEADGICPSYDEMAQAIRTPSRSTVHRLVVGLERRGLIRRRPGRSRSIEILRDPLQPAPPAPPPLVQAVERLLASIQHEDPGRGIALVGSAELGELDIALAEAG